MDAVVAQYVEVGDVVQIDPFHDEMFGSCFMVVEKLYKWGAQGYVQVPGKDGLAYYRCPWEGMEKIGQAAWIIHSTQETSG